MENQENIEPTGWNENQKRNESAIDSQNDDQLSKEQIDDANNDLAGVANGNGPDEETQNPNPDDINDGKGFLGDFATVQHDDEAENLASDDDEHSKHTIT